MTQRNQEIGSGEHATAHSLASLREVMAVVEAELRLAADRFPVGASTLLDLWAVVAGVPGALSEGLAGLLGIARSAELDRVRGEMETIGEEIARLRRRDDRLAASIANLEEQCVRFDAALSALARVQGRSAGQLERLARIGRQPTRRAVRLEKVGDLRTRLERLARRAEEVAVESRTDATRGLSEPDSSHFEQGELA